MTEATGWNNGLNQDYDRKLGKWFASKAGAREDVRKAMAQPSVDSIDTSQERVENTHENRQDQNT